MDLKIERNPTLYNLYDIIALLENQQKKAVDEAQAKIERLKGLR
jgi:hypothetical protein